MSDDGPVYKVSKWGAEYHSLTTNEALGAGAAGPGKSVVLTWEPLPQIVVEFNRCNDPGYIPPGFDRCYPLEWGRSLGCALHLRRTSPMLDETIARTKVWFPQVDPNAEWRESDLQWTFSSGYRYKFGHCKDPDDWGQFLSKEFTLILYDELCVTPDTDVLTESGWKPIADVTIGERVLSLTKDGRAEYRKVLAAPTYVYDGPILKTKNKYVRYSVTPNHRMVVLPQKKTQWEFKKAGEMGGYPRFPFFAEWTGVDVVGPMALPIPSGRGHGRNANNAESVCVDDYVEFLGWYLSEGSAFIQKNTVRGSGGSPVVSLAQTKPCPRLDALVARLPWRARPEGAGRTGYKFFSRQLFDIVRPFGSAHEKRVPRWVMGLSKRQLHIFFDAFAEGDGHRTPTDSVAFGLCNEGLCGDLQEIAAKLGRRATKRVFVDRNGYTVHHLNVHGYDATPTQDNPRNQFTERYNGLIHCITVEGTQTFLARNDGRMWWSGNTQFNEDQYDHINTRLRTSDPVLGKMLKIRAMSNPLTGREHMDGVTLRNPHWVRDRFVDPAPEGRVVLYSTITRANGEKAERTRIYVPATLFDNPDPEFVRRYELELLAAKPHIRQAMLYGNWYVTAGSFYGDVWDENIHTCEPFAIPDEWPCFRSMDWGFKAPGCVHWYSLDPEGTLFCWREYTFKGKDASEVAKRIREIEEDEGLWEGKRSLITGPADTQLWEKRGEAGKSKAEEMMEAGVQWVPADKKSRERNAERVYARLADHQNHTQQPGLVIFKRACPMLVKTLPALQTDSTNAELPQDGGDDHWHDSLSYGCAFASRGAKGIPRKKKPDEWDEGAPKKRASGSWGYGS